MKFIVFIFSLKFVRSNFFNSFINLLVFSSTFENEDLEDNFI